MMPRRGAALVLRRHRGDGQRHLPGGRRGDVGAPGAGRGSSTTARELRDLPTLRARLAEMSVRTEQARALLGYTVGEIDNPSATTPLFVLQSAAGVAAGGASTSPISA